MCKNPTQGKCTRALFPIPGWRHSVVGYFWHFWHWHEYEYEKHIHPSFFETNAGPEYLLPSGFPWVNGRWVFFSSYLIKLNAKLVHQMSPTFNCRLLVCGDRPSLCPNFENPSLAVISTWERDEIDPQTHSPVSTHTMSNVESSAYYMAM